jgi:DNA-binding SARP family transcriptional activator/class 3 adenylate cyclase
LEFRLLGPLELRDRGRALAIGGHKQRALLAMLLLHANQTVPSERLVDALWDGQPPANPRRTLQFFVHRLRKLLAGGDTRLTAGPLLTRGSGYMLQVEPDQLDAARFRRQLDRAREAHGTGALLRAAEALELALELWRGPALADFAEAPFAQAEIARLEELRLAAVEEQMEIGLALGRHAALVGELETLVREHPLREQFRAQHILALYRSGRQAEALDAYQAVRRAFVEELGIEPGSGLKQLEQAILEHAATLDPPGRTRDSDRTHAAPPPAAPAGAGGASDPERAEVPPGQGAAAQGGEEAEDPGPEPHRPPEVRRREERKVVTVLLAGLTLAAAEGLDPEDARQQMADLHERMTDRIDHYGGVVQTVVASQLLAVFGAPRSREDDPERAVRAGLEMCALVDAAGTGQRAQVGLATGEVIATLTTAAAAESGAPAPQADGSRPPALAPGESITVAGDVVHAAAALQAGAPPGAVAVGSGTYRATRHAIEYHAIQPASPLERLTGSPAWQALAPRARTGVPVADLQLSPLIEREQELAVFGDLLDRLRRDREPQLLTLVSVPGMGKSRLVSELAQLADSSPELINWRQGRSLPYGEPTAFRPLAEIVKAHTGILETDPAGVAEDKLRWAVTEAFDHRDDIDQVLDQLNVLLRPRPVTPLPRDRQREVFTGWRRFLSALASDRPLVVVFEDLHWSDDALLDFIDALTHSSDQVPLLVVCTARPELLERRAGWGGGKRNAMTVSLSPLSEEGTGDLLDHLLQGAPLAADIRDALIAKSGGNPLYVEEYARMLRDLGMLGPGGDGAAAAGLHLGTWAPQEADGLPIPESVQQLIAARLDALPLEDKLLLQDAAVVGAFGWAGALESMGSRDRGEVEEGLHRLERRELLRRARVASVGADIEYVFRHTLVREVAYGQILRAQRAEKHRQVVGWMENLKPGRNEDRIEFLAHHYEQALTLSRAAGQSAADLGDRARQVLTAAGDLASAQGALATAANFYRSAIQLWPSEEPPNSELLLQLGRSLVYSKHAGEEYLVQAREKFDAEGRRDRAAEAEAELSQLAIMRGDAGRAEQHLQRALGKPIQATPSLAEVLLQRAIQSMLADEHAAAIRTGREVIARASELGHAELQSSALGVIGQARVCSGDLGGATDMERAIALMEENHAPTVSLARFGLAWSLYWYGAFDRCTAAIVSGQRSTADAATVHWFDAVQAGMDYAGGRWNLALALAERALDSPEGGELGFVQPWCRTLRGRIRLGRGDVEGALEDALAAIEPAKALGPRHHSSAQALAGRALLAAGRRDDAAECLDELLARQREHPSRFTATPDLGDLLLDLDRPGDTLAPGLAPTRWHAAVQALVERDFPEAARRYAQLGSPADEGCARFRQALVCQAAGQPEATLVELEQVIALLRQADAGAYLRYAEALRVQLGGDPPA